MSGFHIAVLVYGAIVIFLMAVAVATVEKSPWQCPDCDFLNDNMRDRCAACGHDRPVQGLRRG